ncbi:hypothetical protein NKR23_g10325 [Pleurostoma richardsiae]|uniref:Autophagy-related protein 33 n=1 Tax=Pleurostoma richardsiae TaxID=41990 RepID=A0AA38R4M4_9PEZI|nr:hypothetical protein NKR23_g10325 [Pleurostoma richardsiae]
MASRGVSVLKFVGTVSLGLLTGLSYTLSTLTVPTLLTLPSASSAAKAFHSLASAARTQLRALAGVSSTAFLLAYLLSPRSYRHPYLLYTSLLVGLSRLAVSDFAAPYLSLGPPPNQSHPSTLEAKAVRKRREHQHRMEMSYDVIGSVDAHSEEGADSASDRDLLEGATEDDGANGEQVRGDVEGFLKRQVVSTAVAGLGFLMAVVGIWGDGAAGYVSETFVIEV